MIRYDISGSFGNCTMVIWKLLCETVVKSRNIIRDRASFGFDETRNRLVEKCTPLDIIKCMGQKTFIDTLFGTLKHQVSSTIYSTYYLPWMKSFTQRIHVFAELPSRIIHNLCLQGALDNYK